MLSGTDMENMLLKSVHEMCIYIYKNYWDMCILPDLTIYESEDRWQAAGLEWSFRQILVALK